MSGARNAEVFMRLGIVGYGNLGKACERICYERNIELTGIFTRREPCDLHSPYATRIYPQSRLEHFSSDVDVLALCLGSKGDLTEFAKRAARHFNTVDTFDTHADMSRYVSEMTDISNRFGKLHFIGVGWDPGLFSLIRALFDAILPSGNTYTFWGEGVSQGHSEAIRRIEGVKMAVQYTIPKENALKSVRNGENPTLTLRDAHRRVCYVVADEGANEGLIADRIREMPNYFADYDTEVNFISEEEYFKSHTLMPHGGFVLRNGATGDSSAHAELSLSLKSNPDFTASVLMAYAAANYKMRKRGECGVKTVLDIPVSELVDGEWIDKVKRFI